MTRPDTAAAIAKTKRLAALAPPAGPGLAPRVNLVRTLFAGDASPARVVGEGPGTLVGYAAVFDVETIIDSWEGKFRERIRPGAFARSLRERGDRVKLQFDHGLDPSIGSKPLGRIEELREDAIGLYVKAPLDDTSFARDIAEMLRSGALDGMSFRFSVREEAWDRPAGQLPLRTIVEANLFEVSVVTFPAYEATTAGLRTQRAYRAWLLERQGPKPPAVGRAAYVTRPSAPPSAAARRRTISRTQRLTA